MIQRAARLVALGCLALPLPALADGPGSGSAAGGEREGKGAPGEEDASELAAPGFPWLLRFANGDVLRARLEDIRADEERVTVVPRLLPDQSLRFALDRVVEMRRVETEEADGSGDGAAAPAKAARGGPKKKKGGDVEKAEPPAIPAEDAPPEPGEEADSKGEGEDDDGEDGGDGATERPPGSDAITLRDGSVLHGRVGELTDRSLRFEAVGLEAFALPLAALLELDRTGGEAKDRGSLAEGEDGVLLTTAGDTITGRIRPTDDGQLLVEGEVVRATCPLSHVAYARFPPSDEAEGSGGGDRGEASGEEEDRQALVTLRNGTSLRSPEPVHLEDGRLRLAVWREGLRVEAAVETVTSISFAGGGLARASRRVLAWKRFSDVDQEHAHALKAMREKLPSFKVSDTDAEPDEFRADLLRCRALVVTEPENWGGGPGEIAPPVFRRVCREFLRRGGNVVFLGFGKSQCAFLRETELLDVRMTGRLTGVDVELTKHQRSLGRGLDGSFKGENATFGYEIGPKGRGAVPLAEAPDGRAVVVGRRVGRGWVILVGLDYYKHGEKHDQLLANAVTFR